MTLQVLFATLIMGLVVSSFDNFPALIYVVVCINAGSLANWLVLNLAFLVFYLFRGVARGVRG
jgi:hypothetical protein